MNVFPHCVRLALFGIRLIIVLALAVRITPTLAISKRGIYHEVSDLRITADDDGDRLCLSGTLHYGEVAEGRDVFMTCFGCDTLGKPVCLFTKVVYDPASHTDVEFTMMAEAFGSVTTADPADRFEVCAASPIPLS